jgi:hypothetical protein
MTDGPPNPAGWRVVSPPPAPRQSRQVPGLQRALRRIEPWLTGISLVLGWAVAVRCGIETFVAFN